MNAVLEGKPISLAYIGDLIAPLQAIQLSAILGRRATLP
jgi:hypothetical protein